jgi:hypothetical protein
LDKIFELWNALPRPESSSWSIRADVVRKLDRGEPESEVHASGSAASDEAASGSEAAPF